MKNIRIIFLLIILGLVGNSSLYARSWTNFKITLDAAYGNGTGPAPNGTGKSVDDLNLDCALAIRARMQAVGAPVSMTRTLYSQNPSLSTRRAHFDTQDAWISCSINLNTWTDNTVNGTEVYYGNAAGNSGALAVRVSAAIAAELGYSNRGAKLNTALVVLQTKSSVPSIQTYGAFVTNAAAYNNIKIVPSPGFNKWVNGHLTGFRNDMNSGRSGYTDLDNPVVKNITRTPTSLAFGDVIQNQSKTMTFSVSATCLTNNISVSSNNAAFTVSSSSLGVGGGTITVTFKPTAVQDYSGSITISATGATSRTVAVSGAGKTAWSLTEKWNFSDRRGTSTNKGWDSRPIRNIAYANGKLYLVYNHSDIKVVKSQSGDELYNLNKTGVIGGGLTLCDVEYFDGKIVACNLPTDNAHPLKVYVWDDDWSEPRVLLEANLAQRGNYTRVGDLISLTGTWNDGFITFGVKNGNETRVLNYKIENGICGKSFISNFLVTETDGQTPIPAFTGTIRAKRDASGYYINGNGGNLRRVNFLGKTLYDFPVTSHNIQRGVGFDQFQFGGKSYLITNSYLIDSPSFTKGAMKLFEVNSTWSSRNEIGSYPSDNLGEPNNSNSTGNTIANTDGNTYVETWVQSTNQGIAYFTFGTPPTHTYPEPEIFVEPDELEFGDVVINDTKSLSFQVSAQYLSQNISVSSNSGVFTVSPASLGVNGGTVTVSFKPTAAQNYSATITLTSGTASKTVTVTGYGVQPKLLTSYSNLFLVAPQNGNRTINFEVTGMYLNNGITVSSNNTAFTVNPSSLPAEGGMVTVIFSPASMQNQTAAITVSAPGAESSKTVNITGWVHDNDLSFTPLHTNSSFQTSGWNTDYHVRAADVHNGKLYLKHRANRTVYQVNPQSGNLDKTYSYEGTYDRYFEPGTDPGTEDKNYCWAGWSVSMGTDGSMFASGNHGDYIGYAFGATTKDGLSYEQVYKSGLSDISYGGRIDFFSLYGTVDDGYLAGATVDGTHEGDTDSNDVICIWKMTNGEPADNSTNYFGKRNVYLPQKIGPNGGTATGADICWIDENSLFVTGESTFPIIYNKSTNTSQKVSFPITSLSGGGAYFKLGDIPYVALPNNLNGSIAVFDVTDPNSPVPRASSGNMTSENNAVKHFSILAKVGENGKHDVATIYIWTPNCGYQVLEFTVPHVWEGSSGTGWNTHGNWKHKVYPAKERDVLIPQGKSTYPTLTQDVEVNKLTIEAGATLDIANSSISINDELTNQGTIRTQNSLPNKNTFGGTVEYYGTGNQIIHTAIYNTLKLSKNGVFTLPNQASIKAANLTLGTNSVLDIGAGRAVEVTTKLINPKGKDGIFIRADKNNPSGTLIFNNSDPIYATVEMYSKAYYTGDPNIMANRHWQYFGIPFKVYENLRETFQSAYIRRYDETASKRWIQLQNEDILQPVQGYQIMQQAPKTYIFSGELYNNSIDNYPLSYTSSAEFIGQHVLANPYTAAIRISDITFNDGVDAIVYQFNTGSRAQWSQGQGQGPKDSPGQYVASPKNTDGAGGIPTQIPSMQGFLIRTNKISSISIPYSSAIKNTEKQRSPRKPTPWLRMNLEDENGQADVMWLLTHPSTTEGYDNGWDGWKISANEELPQLYSENKTGQYQVNTQADIHQTEIVFQAGKESQEYTIHFEYGDGMREQYDQIYLEDKVLGLLIDISEPSTSYSFRSSTTKPSQRFKIHAGSQDMDLTLGTTDVYVYTSGNQITISNFGKEEAVVELYDTVGNFISSYTCGKTSQRIVHAHINKGTYVARIITSRVVSKKLLIQ